MGSPDGQPGGQGLWHHHPGQKTTQHTKSQGFSLCLKTPPYEDLAFVTILAYKNSAFFLEKGSTEPPNNFK